MKHPFDERIINEISIHSREEYPNECCGLIVKNEYLKMINTAEDTVQDFRIDINEFVKYNKSVEAIIHSHADQPHLSKIDMEQQVSTKLPWGVAFVQKGVCEGVVFFGDQVEPYPLVGRPFVHGCFDCYSLVRDYYKIERDITLPIFPRNNKWWETDESMLERGCREAGFDYIDILEAKEGDVVFMQLRSKVVNHSGVYLGNGVILHQLYGKLSIMEPVSKWFKYITSWLRYNKC